MPLNFGGQKRSGAFDMVWPSAEMCWPGLYINHASLRSRIYLVSYPCIGMYKYVCVCISMYMYVYVCVCISMYMYVYLCICMCMCVYVYLCIFMYIYVYACICMYAYNVEGQGGQGEPSTCIHTKIQIPPPACTSPPTPPACP